MGTNNSEVGVYIASQTKSLPQSSWCPN